MSSSPYRTASPPRRPRPVSSELPSDGLDATAFRRRLTESRARRATRGAAERTFRADAFLGLALEVARFVVAVLFAL